MLGEEDRSYDVGSEATALVSSDLVVVAPVAIGRGSSLCDHNASRVSRCRRPLFMRAGVLDVRLFRVVHTACGVFLPCFGRTSHCTAQCLALA